MTLIPRLGLKALDALALDPSTKGLPYDAPPLSVGDVGRQGWSLLDGDLPLPLAVVRDEVVKANSAWMKAFTATNSLVIAPHGKTTMSPALFDLQVADGAWAITVATVQQLEVCRRFGVGRVLMANQPIGALAVDACFRAIQSGLEFYCLVDGPDGLAMLAEGARRNPPPSGNPLHVLVEMGFVGGRTGTRTRDEAIRLARTAAATPGLVLAGFECFEGLLPTADTAQLLVDDVVALSRQAVDEGLFHADFPVVLSAGGSAFFDRVGERLSPVALSRPLVRVLRSGCYLTHDSIAYAEAFARIVKETKLPLPPGGLNPALEVWAHVQSRPEDIRAILTMGKRDVGFDAGLPVPLKWYRPGGGMSGPATMPTGHVVKALNDQHCHMELPENSPLRPGDMVAFGIGHPCTTFDKWQLLMLVDESYRVIGGLKTFF